MATPLFGFTSTGATAPNQVMPPDVAGLVLWLDSADLFYLSLSGTSVLSWTDKASSRTLTPTTGGVYGTRASTGSGVNFPNAGSDFGTYGLGYNTTWYLPTQNFSVFVVFKPTASSTYAASFGLTTSNNLGASGRPNFFLTVQTGTSEKTGVGVDFDGANFASVMASSGNGGIGLNVIRVDEIVMTSSSSTTKILTNGVENTYSDGPDSYSSAYTNYPVGYIAVAAYATAWGARTFTGVVYEVFMYNRAVTSTERTGLENYAYLKWRFSPTDFSSNVYWFDAADTSTITATGSTLTAWANKGTSSMTFAANTGTVTSGLIRKNGRNVVSFPTSSKLVSAATNLGITGNDETIFVVYQKRTNLTTAGAINFMTANNPNPGGNPNGFNLYYNSIAYGTDLTTSTNYYDLFWTVCGGYCFTSAGNTPAYSPYVYQLLSLVVSTTNRGFWSFGGNNNGVGAGPGQYFAGCGDAYFTTTMTFNMGASTVDWDLAEYIVYNRVLTTNERQIVEGYLSIKWGIPLVPSHPYYNIPQTNTFTPTIISGSILWLDAADVTTFTGGSTWTDKSGTNNHGINGTPGSSAMPTTTTWSNGRQAARFVTASKNSVKTTNTIPNYVTYFIVARIQAAVGYGFFMINDLDGQRQIVMNTSSFPVGVYFAPGGTSLLTGSFAQSQPFVVCGTVTAGSAIGYGNGVQTATNSSPSASGTSRNYFGSANGDAGYLTIDIGEIIIYNSILSTENRQKVEAYLANKWGISM